MLLSSSTALGMMVSRIDGYLLDLRFQASRLDVRLAGKLQYFRRFFCEILYSKFQISYLQVSY